MSIRVHLWFPLPNHPAFTVPIPPAGDSLRFLSSATFTDTATSTNYVYLLWQAEFSSLLKDRTYSLHRKSGPAASPAPYSRIATVALQTRANILNTIVNSMPAELGDAATLEAAIDELLGDIMPGIDLTLGDKLSAAAQAARADQQIYERLAFLSRGQPILAVCLGHAAVAELPGNVTTFEFRMQPDGGSNPSVPFDRVAGRVTIDLTAPLVIPAPGPPVHVPDTSPTGHLNARLRWGIPNPLLRKSPLTFGYSVFRMTKAFAEGNGYHTTPPTNTTLASLLDSDPADVAQVNDFSVMPTNILKPGNAAGEAGDLAGDPDTYFIVDDNDALRGEGAPFSDGDQFYYFCAARDLLGRPGTISDATLIIICDRMPPLPPVRVKVTNYRTSTAGGKTKLQIAWSPNPAATEAPDHYLVFRWENPAEMVAANTPAEYNPKNIGTPIAHVPGTDRYTHIDTGASSPSIPGDLNKTYWYSVRAVESTACGDLASGNSAPGFGVLRDRVGPAGGGATITLRRWCPEIIFESFNYVTLTDPLDATFEGFNGPNARHVEVELNRIDNRIAGAAIYLCWEDPNGDLPTQYTLLQNKTFSPGNNQLLLRRRSPLLLFAQGAGFGLMICARDETGKTDYRKVPLEIIQPDNSLISSLEFLLDMEEQVKVITGGSINEPTHTAIIPGTDTQNPIEIDFTPTAGTREYKLYKRIDGGELILLEQAEYDSSMGAVAITDEELPANCAQVCYFIQFFDEHGNPSPLSDLGCVTTTSKVDLPVPILGQPVKHGTQAAPTATLTWFCEETGVERFEIYISEGPSPIGTNFSSELTRKIVPVLSMISPGTYSPTAGPGSAPTTTIDGKEYIIFQTGRVGGNFGDPATPGSFSIDLDVLSGREYTFFIRAINKAGDSSENSNLVNFTWTVGNTAALQVPWPARGLPATDPDFIDQIEAQYLPFLHGGTGAVLIGELTTPGNYDVDYGFIQRDGPTILRNPTNWPDDDSYSIDLYESRGGETVLPFVLYRYQVTNENYPTVSGDITQVSPLIDRVRTQTTGGGTPRIELVDPFLELQPEPGDTGRIGLYVRDTQGVIKGASYVYLLVRFKDNGEIDRTIPTNPLLIPFTP